MLISLPGILPPGLHFAFEKKRMPKNSVFPGAVIWRSFVKQETKKAFVLQKISKRHCQEKLSFLHTFFFSLKNEAQTRGKNAGQ